MQQPSRAATSPTLSRVTVRESSPTPSWRDDQLGAPMTADQLAIVSLSPALAALAAASASSGALRVREVPVMDPLALGDAALVARSLLPLDAALFGPEWALPDTAASAAPAPASASAASPHTTAASPDYTVRPVSRAAMLGAAGSSGLGLALLPMGSSLSDSDSDPAVRVSSILRTSMLASPAPRDATNAPASSAPPSPPNSPPSPTPSPSPQSPVLTTLSRMSPWQLSNSLEDWIGDADVIAPVSSLRALFHGPLCPDQPVSLTVHRIGETLILDPLDPDMLALATDVGHIPRLSTLPANDETAAPSSVLTDQPRDAALPSAPLSALAEVTPSLWLGPLTQTRDPLGLSSGSATRDRPARTYAQVLTAPSTPAGPSAPPAELPHASSAGDEASEPERRFVVMRSDVSVMTSPTHVDDDTYYARANTRSAARARQQDSQPSSSSLHSILSSQSSVGASLSDPVVGRPIGPAVIADPAGPLRASEPITDSPFRRVAVWEFQGLRLVLGSDLLVLRDAARPVVVDGGAAADGRISIALHMSADGRLTRSQALDMYLENCASNVPETVLCHIAPLPGASGPTSAASVQLGVQRIERIPTEDLPALGADPFSPYAAEQSAAALLRFLKEHCVRDCGSYWLVRRPGESLMRLYDLTGTSAAPEARGQWRYQLAMLCHRLARRAAERARKLRGHARELSALVAADLPSHSTSKRGRKAPSVAKQPREATRSQRAPSHGTIQDGRLRDEARHGSADNDDDNGDNDNNDDDEDDDLLSQAVLRPQDGLPTRRDVERLALAAASVERTRRVLLLKAWQLMQQVQADASHVADEKGRLPRFLAVVTASIAEERGDAYAMRAEELHSMSASQLALEAADAAQGASAATEEEGDPAEDLSVAQHVVRRWDQSLRAIDCLNVAARCYMSSIEQWLQTHTETDASPVTDEPDAVTSGAVDSLIESLLRVAARLAGLLLSTEQRPRLALRTLNDALVVVGRVREGLGLAQVHITPLTRATVLLAAGDALWGLREESALSTSSGAGASTRTPTPLRPGLLAGYGSLVREIVEAYDGLHAERHDATENEASSGAGSGEDEASGGEAAIASLLEALQADAQFPDVDVAISVDPDVEWSLRAEVVSASTSSSPSPAVDSAPGIAEMAAQRFVLTISDALMGLAARALDAASTLAAQVAGHAGASAPSGFGATRIDESAEEAAHASVVSSAAARKVGALFNELGRRHLAGGVRVRASPRSASLPAKSDGERQQLSAAGAFVRAIQYLDRNGDVANATRVRCNLAAVLRALGVALSTSSIAEAGEVYQTTQQSASAGEVAANADDVLNLGSPELEQWDAPARAVALLQAAVLIAEQAASATSMSSAIVHGLREPVIVGAASKSSSRADHLGISDSVILVRSLPRLQSLHESFVKATKMSKTRGGESTVAAEAALAEQALDSLAACMMALATARARWSERAAVAWFQATQCSTDASAIAFFSQWVSDLAHHIGSSLRSLPLLRVPDTAEAAMRDSCTRLLHAYCLYTALGNPWQAACARFQAGRQLSTLALAGAASAMVALRGSKASQAMTRAISGADMSVAQLVLVMGLSAAVPGDDTMGRQLLAAQALRMGAAIQELDEACRLLRAGVTSILTAPSSAAKRTVDSGLLGQATMLLELSFSSGCRVADSLCVVADVVLEGSDAADTAIVQRAHALSCISASLIAASSVRSAVAIALAAGLGGTSAGAMTLGTLAATSGDMFAWLRSAIQVTTTLAEPVGSAGRDLLSARSTASRAAASVVSGGLMRSVRAVHARGLRSSSSDALSALESLAGQLAAEAKRIVIE